MRNLMWILACLGFFVACATKADDEEDYGGAYLSGKCSDFEEVYGSSYVEWDKVDTASAEEYLQFIQEILSQQEEGFNASPLNLYYEHYLLGDTNEFYFLLKNYKELLNAGVPSAVIRILSENSLAISGTVVSKEDFSEDCVNFKTRYRVVVDRVDWSKIEGVRVGDTVLVGSMWHGFVGGCARDSARRFLYQATSGIQSYEEGESGYFLLDKGHYTRKIALGRFRESFEDQYCSGMLSQRPISDSDKELVQKHAKYIVDHLKN